MNNSLTVTILGIVTVFLVCLLLLPAVALYYAWAISLLWAWFMVPLGLPSISLAHAYGLMLFVGMFKGVQVQAKGEKDWTSYWASLVLNPPFAVGFGWIVKTVFMS